MRKLVTFVAGMLALAAVFILIVGPAIALALWCVRKSGMPITCTQIAWLAAAWWVVRMGLLLFGRVFAWLRAKGTAQQQRTSLFEARAPSPLHRHLMN